MLLWISIISYFASGMAAVVGITSDRQIKQWSINVVALIGLAAHSAQLLLEFRSVGMLQMSLLNSISISVWMTILVIMISTITKPLHNLFTFFLPAGALLLLIGVVSPHLAEPRAYSGGMLFHIFLSLLAYSVVIVATIQAILVNIQSNKLHNHNLESRLFALLPPLQSMEKLMFEWLVIGFILLTGSIVSGAIYVDDMLAQHLIHKTVLTVIAWGFFAALIFGHFFLGWRGQVASRLIYFGSGFLLIAFIGSKFVLEYLLLRA